MAIDDTASRPQLASCIRDLVLHELGEDIDVTLMLGPAEYSRAVLSLCRSCGSAELVRLAEQFLRASNAETQRQRAQQTARQGADALDRRAAARVPATRPG